MYQWLSFMLCAQTPILLQALVNLYVQNKELTSQAAYLGIAAVSMMWLVSELMLPSAGKETERKTVQYHPHTPDCSMEYFYNLKR